MALVVATVVAWSGALAMAAPVPVVPALRGVYDPGNGGPLKALWGYSNPNTASVAILPGVQNFFSPGPSYLGQPTTFVPGTVYGAFVTDIADGAPLTWTLNGTSVSALATPPLPVDPSVLMKAGEVIPFVQGVWEYGPNDYAAVFGYASGAAGTRTIPYGAGNLLSPGPNTNGQPLNFMPGVFGNVFVAHFQGPSLTWSLTSGGYAATATADANSPRLAADPLPEPGWAGIAAMLAAAGGLVRRRRPQKAA
jgi:hypothetical protein